ncbi:MAG: phosphotransferase enzyme family protein [Lentimicrobiaceae bacterium]|jgi:aminoglycoside/choline kinase family phosphotransferase|nr:phosphotransferase enzyme family protein [Lentimicrobiaceae bacterium]MDG1901236.1 RNase adapter RapZ [Bacteroidales bacterium]MDG2080569.1 RNase adapter RapZ [Bacteroidales bacterium]|tara:strand:+ start:593 stop:2014 length:1422 start_codon:yes stop_codon:yes gene_type:complete
MANQHINNIRQLIRQSGYKNEYDIIPLPISGSNRLYFRAINRSKQKDTIIASFNEDVNENIAHYSFTNHFMNMGISVPEIIARDDSYKYFLVQDLGKTALFDLNRHKPKEAIEYYIKVVSDLVEIQVEGIKNIDLELAYPVKHFDQRSIMWDLNYFKYYFLKTHNINFNENLLEIDFEKFTEKLLLSESKYFNYRDFQSRNIMIHKNKPWYIDFQGGRMGPLQYDLVSLLNQVNAKLSSNEKKIIYTHYLSELSKKLPDKVEMFEKYYHDYEYFRLMQVMGAYGYRGIVQKKAHFLQSLLPSIKSLNNLLKGSPFDEDMKELNKIFNQIIKIDSYSTVKSNTVLNVSINSFSYKMKGIPIDITGNGGGHVFDCRSLPNPGRIADLRDFTGLEEPIIQYLEKQEEVGHFLKNAHEIILQSVDNYILRGFAHLQINFGCTGGRHRSVYSANLTHKLLEDKYPNISITLKHNELNQ